VIPAEQLAAHLAAVTAQDPGSGNSDRARPRRCPACNAPVLIGLDDTLAAFRAVVDPTPLDRAGEVAALLTDRDTYRLTDPPRVSLRRRDRWQIQGRPADTTTVLPAHACGAPLGQPVAPTSQEPASDHIPF
jgi:hypothetical protein